MADKHPNDRVLRVASEMPQARGEQPGKLLITRPDGVLRPDGSLKPARRRLLLAAGGLVTLAACGVSDDDEEHFYYLDDTNDATEIRLSLWRILEVRLAVNRADGLLTFLNSETRPELDYKSGPDFIEFDDRSPGRNTAYERWRFRAVDFGHTTLRFDYAPNRHAPPQRVVTFRIVVR